MAFDAQKTKHVFACKRGWYVQHVFAYGTQRCKHVPGYSRAKEYDKKRANTTKILHFVCIMLSVIVLLKKRELLLKLYEILLVNTAKF